MSHFVIFAKQLGGNDHPQVNLLIFLIILPKIVEWVCNRRNLSFIETRQSLIDMKKRSLAFATNLALA